VEDIVLEVAWPFTPFAEDLEAGVSRVRCNFGAILTSVFVVRRRAFPFVEGSKLALEQLSIQLQGA
jgi:hypothetical protein